MVGATPDLTDAPDAPASDAEPVDPEHRTYQAVSGRGPALVILGIAVFLLLAGVLASALVTGSSPTESMHSVTIPGGTVVPLRRRPPPSTRSSLRRQPPADILGNLAVPAGSSVRSTLNSDQNSGQFDRTVSFTSGTLARPVGRRLPHPPSEARLAGDLRGPRARAVGPAPRCWRSAVAATASTGRSASWSPPPPSTGITPYLGRALPAPRRRELSRTAPGRRPSRRSCPRRPRPHPRSQAPRLVRSIHAQTNRLIGYSRYPTRVAGASRMATSITHPVSAATPAGIARWVAGADGRRARHRRSPRPPPDRAGERPEMRTPVCARAARSRPATTRPPTRAGTGRRCRRTPTGCENANGQHHRCRTTATTPSA